ncbi:MAG: EpsD family peptidyl-prolyl cis-trans isomerase, partial [Burkholderiales bacterium]
MSRRVSILVVVLACTACSPRPDAASGSGQVVARVDGREVTVLQLQQALGAGRARADDPYARRLALDALVDRTLLAARARADGLDRDPAVLAQVQAAIDRVHAQAALESIAAAVPRPDPDAQRAFRDANPALFAQRRVYTVDEVSFESASLDAVALRARVATARRIEELTDWLSARGIAVARRAGTLLPEEAGTEVAATLQPRAEGDLVLLGAAPAFRVLAIRRIEPRPATGPRADAWIERHLLEAARREAVDAAVAAMRA